MIKSLKELLALFKSWLNPITIKNNRLILFQAAIDSIGIDASPNDIAPDELGCAETVNNIHQNAFGFPIGGDLSTYRMYRAIKESSYFRKVENPLEGDIIISPTGYGRGDIMTGHVGIVGQLPEIMANDSKTGTWIVKWTIDSWKERWQKRGGYPVHYYRRV